MLHGREGKKILKKKKNSSIVIIVFLVLILFFMSIRFFNIDNTIVFDEYVQTKAAIIEHNEAGLDKGTEIPPLTNWIRIAFSELLGKSTQVLKFASLVFGTLTVGITYLLARQFYDKIISAMSALLLSISSWHMLGSTSISFDGAFLTFFFSLTIYLFVLYIKSGKIIYLTLTGVIFGMVMLTKLNGIIVIPIIIIYGIYYNYSLSKSARRESKIRNEREPSKNLMIKNKKFSLASRILQNSLKEMSIIGIIGATVFLIFPLAAYMTDWSYFTVVLQHTKSLQALHELNLPILLIQFAQALFWIGPLYIGLLLIKIFDIRNFAAKKDMLFYIWMAIALFFYVFIIKDNFRPIERYLFIILPPLCILGSDALTRILFRYPDTKAPGISLKGRIIKRRIILLISMIAIMITAMSYAAMNTTNTLPFYPKTEYITRVMNLEWNFLVPFTGDQGPIGMYIPFTIIAGAFILSGAILTIQIYMIIKNLITERKTTSHPRYYKSRKKSMKNSNSKISSALFMVFLAVSLSYNFFMGQELLFSLTTPDIDKINKEVIVYAKEMDLNGQVYVFRNNAYIYYLKNENNEIKIMDFNNLNQEYLDNIFDNTEKKTFIIIDFPSIGENNIIWNVLEKNCIRINRFEDKIPIGHIYTCQ